MKNKIFEKIELNSMYPKAKQSILLNPDFDYEVFMNTVKYGKDYEKREVSFGYICEYTDSYDFTSFRKIKYLPASMTYGTMGYWGDTKNTNIGYIYKDDSGVLCWYYGLKSDESYNCIALTDYEIQKFTTGLLKI